MKKTYRKQIDKYGTYYKCLVCYARNESEAYIKTQLCHKPLMNTAPKKKQTTKQ